MIDFALVDPGFVESHLADRRGGEHSLLLEAHFSSVDHPLVGDVGPARHLPGAIQIHPSYLEAGRDVARYYPAYTCPADGNLLPDDRLIAALEDLGITADTTVLVYGSEPDGIMAAARLIWGLMVAGVKKIRLLDGGLSAWLAHGGATVSEIGKADEIAGIARRPETNSDARLRICREYLATTAEVSQVAALNGGTRARLVDVRRPDEFSGTRTGYYPFFSKAGHIPNATLQGKWGNLVDDESGKLGPRLPEIRRRWRDLGIVDEDVEQGTTGLIFYCGTGWRSSLSFLAAILLGYRAKNYDDGFYGWSWDGRNEVAYADLPGEVTIAAPARSGEALRVG